MTCLLQTPSVQEYCTSKGSSVTGQIAIAMTTGCIGQQGKCIIGNLDQKLVLHMMTR